MYNFQGQIYLQNRQIANTMFCNDSIIKKISTLQKIQWVINSVDYSSYTDEDIEKQYKRLKRQLMNINQQVQKAVQKVTMSTIPASLSKRSIDKDPQKIVEIRQMEVQNNKQILELLQKQYQSIYRRTERLKSTDKYAQQEEIAKVKLQIQQSKNKIKELKQKNKQLGCAIISPDNNLEQLKRLTQQVQIAQKKQSKLRNKYQKSLESIMKVEEKLYSINDDYQIAENFFIQSLQTENYQSESRKFLHDYNMKKHQFLIIKKKNQSVITTKSQKYHNLLKQLENLAKNSLSIGDKISQCEINILQNKGLIEDLMSKLKQKNVEISQEFQYGASINFLTQFQQKQRHNQAAVEEEIENNFMEIKLSNKQYNNNSIKITQEDHETQQEKIQDKVVINNNQSHKIEEGNNIVSFSQIKEQFYNQEESQDQEDNDNITQLKQQTDQNTSMFQSFLMKKRAINSSIKKNAEQTQEVQFKQFQQQSNKMKQRLSKRKDFHIELNLKTLRQSIETLQTKTFHLKDTTNQKIFNFDDMTNQNKQSQKN